MSVCMCAKIFNLLEYFNFSRAIIQASLEDRLGKKFFLLWLIVVSVSQKIFFLLELQSCI